MGVAEATTFPGREDTSQVRLLHDLAKIHATFDDPNLVSRAGLVPVMALAQRAGLGGLAEEHVRPGGRCGVNAQLKLLCLVGGMIGGADSIDDMDLLRHGAMPALFGGVRAPSTLGSFLRSEDRLRAPSPLVAGWDARRPEFEQPQPAGAERDIEQRLR